MPSFVLHFQRHWDLSGRRKTSAGQYPSVLGGAGSANPCGEGRWAELLLTPELSILLSQLCRARGRTLVLSHPPPFPYAKQLELRADNGPAGLTQAAIEFPLLVSLASGSFTFCKVASLLPCSD